MQEGGWEKVGGGEGEEEESEGGASLEMTNH